MLRVKLGLNSGRASFSDTLRYIRLLEGFDGLSVFLDLFIIQSLLILKRGRHKRNSAVSLIIASNSSLQKSTVLSGKGLFILIDFNKSEARKHSFLASVW